MIRDIRTLTHADDHEFLNLDVLLIVIIFENMLPFIVLYIMVDLQVHVLVLCRL